MEAPASSAGLATGSELPELRQALARVAALEEEKEELEASKAELSGEVARLTLALRRAKREELRAVEAERANAAALREADGREMECLRRALRMATEPEADTPTEVQATRGAGSTGKAAQATAARVPEARDPGSMGSQPPAEGRGQHVRRVRVQRRRRPPEERSGGEMQGPTVWVEGASGEAHSPTMRMPAEDMAAVEVTAVVSATNSIATGPGWV